MVVFGKEEDQGNRQAISSMLRKISDVMERVRLIEQKIGILDSTSNSIKEDVYNYKKIQQKGVSEINERIDAMERRLTKVENLVKELIKQLKFMATKTEINELRELIEIYNPLKSSFVTREEVERLREEIKRVGARADE